MRAAGVETAQARARRPKDRKAQIALVAAELFCDQGYHGVGVDEIAAGYPEIETDWTQMQSP